MKINHIVDEDITRRGFLQGAGAAAVAGAAGSAMAQLSPDEKAKYLKYLQQDVDRYQREYIRKKEWEEEQAKRDDAMRKKGIDPYKVTDSQSLRQSNLDRMKQMVEPLSASYAERIIARIRPNILFTSEIEGNPVAEVEMRCAPDGTILERKIIKSSGNAEWDQAVIKAIDKSDRIPRDVDGKVPLPIVISFRPKDISTKESVNQGMAEAARPPVAPDPQNYNSDWDYYNDRDADDMTDSDPADDMTDDEPDDWFDESKEKVGNMDADAFDAALSRMKKLAGAGPLRTVYDPARRVYKNVPHAVQPAQQPKKGKIMKFNDFIVSEEKVRLDPKCWTGKKIGNPKTKMKGGVRVNNCVPAESVEEAANPAQQAAIAIAKKKKAGVDEAAPPGAKAERMVKHIKKGYAKDGKLSDKEKSIAYATAWKAHNKGVTEAMRPIPVDDQGNRIPDRMPSNEPERPFGQPGDAKSSPKGVVTYTPTGLIHKSNHGDVTPRPRAVPEDASPDYIWIQGDFDGDTATTGSKQGSWRDQQTTQVELTRGRMSNVRPLSGPPPEGGKTIKQAQIPLTLDAGNTKFSTTGVDLQLTVAPNGYISQGGVGRVRGTAVVKIMRPGNVAEGTQQVDSLVTDALKIMQGSEASDAVAALKTVLGDREYNSRRGFYNFYVRQLMDMSGRMAEDYNPEYDDEAGMADNNLETLERAVDGIDNLIQSGDNLPEWCQEKIAVAKSMLVAVWDYMYSEEASDEVDPEVDEMFEAMDQLAEEMARKKGVSVDLVWETFEAMDDHMLYETAAWRRKEGKSKKGGLNAKGVASYRRENPGSKLQMAVTTKPSKLKKGSKAAKRRKSFCARMGGVKGPMKKPNGKPTRKALALRKWNC